MAICLSLLFFCALLFMIAAPCVGYADPLREPLPAPVVGEGSTSVRPILVDVEFEGNEELSDGQLQAQIKTRPTERNFIQRFFRLYARLYDINILAPQAYRDQIHRVVDSISGEARYLNLKTVAADTIAIRQLYEDHGFHNTQVRFRVTLDTVSNRAIVRYIINEGPRYELRNYSYIGLDEVPKEVREPLSTPEAFDLGDDFSKQILMEEVARALDHLQNNGYPFPSLSNEVAVITVDTPYTDVPYDSALISIDPGERYRFGRTEYIPDSAYDGLNVKEDAVVRQIEYEPGEWYDKRKVDQTISNLYALGTFEFVRIDTAMHLSGGDSLGLQILTRLRKRWEFQATPELSLQSRVREYIATLGLNTSIRNINLFGSAERATLAARTQFAPRNATSAEEFFNEFQWGVSASYQDPTLLDRWLGASRSTLSLLGSYNVSVEDRLRGPTLESDVVLKSTRAVAGTEVSWRFPPYTFIGWFDLLTTRATYQYTEYSNVRGYTDTLAVLRIRERSTDLTCANIDTAAIQNVLRNEIYRVQVLQSDDTTLATGDVGGTKPSNDFKQSIVFNGGLTRDRRDNLFSPTKGHFLNLQGEIGLTGFVHGAWGKLDADIRFYGPVFARSTWAARAHVGMIMPFGRNPLVPLVSRFFAGGSSSIRGWGPRELLATTPPNAGTGCERPIIEDILNESRRLIGGLALLELSGDIRTRLFDLAPTSTLNRQLNQIIFVGSIDVGNAFYKDYETDPLNLLESVAWSMGIALGYDTPIGPFRVGYGIPFYNPQNPTETERFIWQHPVSMGDGTWHVAIGYAF